MRRHKNNQQQNDIIKSNFFVRLVNFFIRLILWPLRHPLISIPVLLLAYFIPTLIGARPAEVHIWYWQKIKAIFSPVSQKSIAFIEEAGKKLSIPDFSIVSKQEDTKNKMVDVETPQLVRRQTFEKAANQEVAIRVDVMEKTPAQEQNTTVATATEQAPQKTESFVTEEPEKVEVYDAPKVEPAPTPRTIQVEPDLIYLSTPQEFSGSAYVVNANEINIGGNSIFLYGIYVNPRSREGTLGKKFLEDLIGNEPVHCVAPAYTRQGVATAICYVGNTSLNHAMVNSGYSKNVSLKPL